MEALIFHRDTGEWRQVEGRVIDGGSLGRRNHPTCGLVDTGSEKYVVVTGGDSISCTCHGYPPSIVTQLLVLIMAAAMGNILVSEIHLHRWTPFPLRTRPGKEVR